MEMEPLEANEFYKHVVEKRKQMWFDAAKGQHVLCLPQNCSLSSANITRQDVGTSCL